MLNNLLIAIVSLAVITYCALYIRLFFRTTLTRIDFFLIGPLKKHMTFFQTHHAEMIAQIRRVYIHYFLFLLGIDVSLFFRQESWVWIVLLVVIVMAILCWRVDKKYEQIIKMRVKGEIHK